MAVSIPNNVRSAACDAIVDLIDVDGPGDLQIATTSFAEILATLEFSNPAFGAAVNGVATADTITPDTNTSAGTAAVFRIRDGNGDLVMNGTVGTSGADINLNSVNFASGGTANITSLTVTIPAGG